MSRWCRVMLAGLVAVFGVAATCLAGAMYQNTSGTAARAVRIEFSEPAEITSIWPSFPQREPQGPATVVILSGGEIAAGSWFSFTWRPDGARVVKIEWLAHPSAARPAALGILWAAGDFAKHGEQLDRTSLVPPSTTPQMGDGLLPMWAWETPTSSYYQERYASLLDALKRMSGTDPEARTDADAFVRGPSEASAKLVRWDRIVVDLRDMSMGKSHRYEGITYDIHGSRVVAEIRAILGDVITTGTAGANVVVSYTTGGKVNRAAPHLEEVSFNPDGQPAMGTVAMQGFCRNEDYLLRAFRLAFARLLTLTQRLEEAAVLDERGAFSEDFVAVLRLMYGLPPGHDLDQYKARRAPVAVAQVQTSESKVGDTIMVDFSASRGLGGAIAGYRLDQVHMGPETLEYMTEWKWEESEYLGGGRFRLVAGQPGRYAMKLTVVDENGLENTSLLAATVAPAKPYDWDYTILNLLDSKRNDIEGLEDTTLDFVASAYSATSIDFVHTFWYTQVKPLPSIHQLDDHPWYAMPLDWTGQVLDRIGDLGFMIVMSEQLYPVAGMDFPPRQKTRAWWEAFFEQIEPILLRVALLAEQRGVEILNVYYHDSAFITDPEWTGYVLPRFSGILSRIRRVYSGSIAITTALGGTYDAPFNLAQFDQLLADPNIDLVVLSYGVVLHDRTEPEPDVAVLRDRIIQSFRSVHGQESFLMTARRLGKPVVAHIRWASAYRQNGFEWFEPSEPSPRVQRDYAGQVRMYEATFAALAEPDIAGAIRGVIVHQLFWNDMFDIYYPPMDLVFPASGDKSPNTRSKPAETLISFIFSYARAAQPR